MLRLASILCNDLHRPDEAQVKLNDVVRGDRDFEVAMVQEVQGDIYLSLDPSKNLDRALGHFKRSI
jgi:superkiller protein 3